MEEKSINLSIIIILIIIVIHDRAPNVNEKNEQQEFEKRETKSITD